MTPISDRKNYVFLFDQLCRQLAHDIALPRNAKGQFDWITKVIRSEKTQEHLEELVNCINSSWLTFLATVCPDLTPANRQLAILLYLGFSTDSIVLLTNRETPGSLHTAKNRLKNIILASQSPQASTLLKSLGFKSK